MGILFKIHGELLSAGKELPPNDSQKPSLAIVLGVAIHLLECFDSDIFVWDSSSDCIKEERESWNSSNKHIDRLGISSWNSTKVLSSLRCRTPRH